MNILTEYREGCRIILQMPYDIMEAVVNDWMKHSTCDIRIRRAKHKGTYALEMKDPVYASRVVQYYHPHKVVFMEDKR